MTWSTTRRLIYKFDNGKLYKIEWKMSSSTTTAISHRLSTIDHGPIWIDKVDDLVKHEQMVFFFIKPLNKMNTFEWFDTIGWPVIVTTSSHTSSIILALTCDNTDHKIHESSILIMFILQFCSRCIILHAFSLKRFSKKKTHTDTLTIETTNERTNEWNK